MVTELVVVLNIVRQPYGMALGKALAIGAFRHADPQRVVVGQNHAAWLHRCAVADGNRSRRRRRCSMQFPLDSQRSGCRKKARRAAVVAPQHTSSSCSPSVARAAGNGKRAGAHASVLQSNRSAERYWWASSRLLAGKKDHRTQPAPSIPKTSSRRTPGRSSAHKRCCRRRKRRPSPAGQRPAGRHRRFPVRSTASGLCAWNRHQPGAFCGSQSTAALGQVLGPPE